METLIESDLPNETYVRIHQTVQLLVLLAATVSIVITTITIVYSKGRGMETYKYYLLHELFWNYGFDTVICLWMPVNMFPYQCSYSIGILKNSTGDYQHFLTCLSSVMATGKALAIYTAVVYRYSQALSPQRHPVLQRLVHPNILVYIAVFVVVQFAMVFPLAVNRSTPFQIQAKSDESAVVKRVSETQPSFICIENGAGGTLTFMYILIGTLLTLFIGTIALCLVHLRQLMRSGSSMSSATYRIQLMLFKSIRMQLLCSAVVLGIPLATGLLFIGLKLRKTPIIVMIMTLITCTHSIFDCLILMYYVRPYREFLIAHFAKILQIERRVVSSVVLMTSKASRTF